MRRNGQLAQVAVGVEMAITAAGPLVDGGPDLRLGDCWVLAPQTGFDHPFRRVEEIKDSETTVHVNPHTLQPRTAVVGVGLGFCRGDLACGVGAVEPASWGS